MQNSNRPSTTSPASPLPSLADALTQAYARARERMIAADAGAHPEEAPGSLAELLGVRAPEPVAAEALSGCGVRFDELLGVFREPIEWALALAERRAHGDPVDIAAIHRVRDAYRRRLASLASPCTDPMDGDRIRALDLVAIAGLLIGASDPAIAQRTAREAGATLLDALAFVLQLEPELPSPLAHGASHGSRAPAHNVPHPVGPFWPRDERHRAAMPRTPTRRLWRSLISLWFPPHIRLGL